MKTLAQFPAGNLLVIVRSDGGVYVGRPDQHGVMYEENLRIGQSAAICEELASALKMAAEYLRAKA